MAHPLERGAMLIVHDHDPRALYFVATLQGKDAARVKKGLAASKRRAFVWMSQSGRAGDPGRALLNDALTEVIGEGEVAWAGALTSEIESAVRKKLERLGVKLDSLRLVGNMPFDEDARARHAWWVCSVNRVPVGGWEAVLRWPRVLDGCSRVRPLVVEDARTSALLGGGRSQSRAPVVLSPCA